MKRSRGPGPGANKRQASKKKKQPKATAKPPPKADDFFIESESSGDEARLGEEKEEHDPYAGETADERKLRMAKEYLSTIEDFTGADGDDGELVDDGMADGLDPVAQRLHREALKLRGKLKKKVAENLRQRKSSSFGTRIMRGHRLPVTCVALSADDSTAYSGSKDGSIIKWDIKAGTKLHTVKRVPKASNRMERREVKGHSRAVLCVAVSTDGKLLATGGDDQCLLVWDTETFEVKFRLYGHRDSITCVAFRENTYTCFSGSRDRTVRVWDLETGAFVESLHGHHSELLSIDSLLQHRAVSSGSDKTCRLWKIPEQTQLLYKGSRDVLDCVRFVDDDRWVTACQDGSVGLWSIKKRKPLFRRDRAHQGKWVTSVGARIFTDLVASGSSDGFVRLWQSAMPHSLLSALNLNSKQ